MWIFVNAHNTSTASYSNETTIFSYAKRTTNPVSVSKITYSLSDNKYYIYVTNYTDATKENSRYEFNITGINSQKWNNIVINYNDNDIDLFINGVFEKTFRVTSDTPKYFYRR
jgi:hypothetical protein